MCGRYLITSSTFDFVSAFNIDHVTRGIKNSFNVAPSHMVSVVINTDIGRRLGELKWGLIPSWSKDPIIGNKLFNARSETLREKPSFKEAFKKRRCLVLADGFYEWKQQDQKKIPMLIRLKSKKPLAFAGLWENWISPDKKKISTCTIITTSANSLIKNIHPRMPVILNQESQKTWLNNSIYSYNMLSRVLKSYNASQMEAYAVSTLVNNVKNDSPDCIKPAA